MYVSMIYEYKHRCQTSCPVCCHAHHLFLDRSGIPITTLGWSLSTTVVNNPHIDVSSKWGTPITIGAFLFKTTDGG